MASQFEPAFHFLMQHEDPGLTGKVTRDSGGLTRWGISQRAYPGLDIANLTLEQAAQICRRDYFQPIRGYEIDEQRVASKLLDMAFNMGVKTAVMLLQVALNTHCQGNDLLAEDGAMGAHTLSAVNRADPSLLLIGMVDASRKHYQHIVAGNHSAAQYLNVWLARAEKLPPVDSGAQS